MAKEVTGKNLHQKKYNLKRGEAVRVIESGR
jgi:hypothetical protein